jgi:hypothetical protein
MWKSFQHNDDLYMIKLVTNQNLDFYVTDLQKIWIQNISKETLLSQFQEFNPLFEIKVDEAVSQVAQLINDISSLEHVEVVKTDDELQLILRSSKAEFKIEFNFNFHKSTSEVFLKEVTVPLIQTVKHLEERQNMLYNLVQKKDRELEEYKLEKGLISRDDLITEKFDESQAGNVDNKSMMNVFGQSIFWDNFVKRYGNIETKIEDVKMDPWNHIKRKRKVYSAKTSLKKGKGIKYNENK